MLSSSTISSAVKAAFVIVFIYAVYASFLTPTGVWTSQLRPIIFTAKPPAFKNVAAIIEDRPLANLAPLLLHFSSVLGPAWPSVLFTSKNTFLNQSIPFRRAVEE
ncbi:hypothetical protein LZ554_001103 [Drepanopeziza brunnea f. sp. 'monogermtubi']|nr:hypothetical protein LZ554_001103 [Drepanopeziza brunnea f. sp. 'monogermtubi']